jgi:tRNA dimethylallyltransferase
VTDDPFRNALILTGPTASGKSALALELAPRLNAEIVSMDSMTLYRGMDIGTAKPTPEERSQVPHHLIDIRNPWESANVAWWLDQAADACRRIENQGRRPLFVGGTPFYLKALLFGLFPSPPASGDLRRRLEAEAEQKGRDQLHSRLAAIDPVTAARLHPNDLRRVVRALEVWELTGKPISAWQRQGWWHEDSSLPAARPQPADDTLHCLAVDVGRPILYDRINRRVENMFAAGWIDEVRRLRALPRPLSREASQALGYREIGEHLDGRRGLQETVGLIQMRTRQFAKRQLTWLRHLPGVQLCDAKLTFSLWPPKMVDEG